MQKLTFLIIKHKNRFVNRKTENLIKNQNFLRHHKHLIGKSHTFTVERMNRLLCHYLARFARKTYCWSRSLSMISFSVSLFAFFY